jgi:hypothetical protein
MDVDDMRAHSKVQNAVIFIDSSTRDKAAWPKPSEFTVPFDEPYRNVVSVTVLDATIPATMYVVDLHNNSLRFFARLSGSSQDLGALQEALLDMQGVPGVRDLFDSPVVGERRIKLYDGVQDPSGEVVDPSVAALGTATGIFRNSAEIQPDRILYEDDAHLEGRTSLAGGKVERYLISADSATAHAPPPPSAIFRGDDGVSMAALTIVTSLDEALRGTSGDFRFLARYSLWNPADAEYTFPPEGTSYTLTYDGSDASFYLVSHTLAPVAAGKQGDHLHELALHVVEMEPGNYDAKGFLLAFAHAMPPDPDEPDARKILTIGSQSRVFAEKDQQFMQYSGAVQLTARHPFWLDMDLSGLGEVLGFTELPSDSRADKYSRLRFMDRRYLFGAIPNLPPSAPGAPPPPERPLDQTPWILRSPGILNLNGTRFIILRCPQIECATSALSAQNVSAGIGLFKLYDQALAHLRFDFIKLSTVNFHPIGKLSRLHLRFERLGGDLYDFKGSDFHVLLVIRFLERVRPAFSPASALGSLGAPGAARGAADRPRAAGRHLNPDYDPDVLRYESRARTEMDESDTDSDEALLEDPEHRARFESARSRIAAGLSAGAEARPSVGIASGPGARGGGGPFGEGFDSGSSDSGADGGSSDGGSGDGDSGSEDSEVSSTDRSSDEKSSG